MKMISLSDEGFLRSASMILASEIGDKTFFIAAILAMNHSRLTVRDETRLMMCSLIPI
jgi:putative Ca2+/H+ antiporter (TMEM165/GDT1 family)